MGLLDLFKKPQHEIYTDFPQESNAKNQYLERQNELLARVNAAKARYKADGNLDNVIQEFEYAFVTANPPCISSQNIDLATYYVKAGQNNKAWSYLNALLANDQAPVKDVRFMQAKILKKENKHVEAIRMYMFAYLAKSQWNNTFQREMFLKDIQPSANKLNLASEKRDRIADLIADAVARRNYSEKSISDSFKELI